MENTNILEIAVAFIVGLSPTIFTAIKDRTRWQTGEKSFMHSEATENIVNAASMLAERSQSLIEKNDDLIMVYEKALAKQMEITKQEIETAEKERKLRIEYEEEIKLLKEQLRDIKRSIVVCSREMVSLIRDVESGQTISNQRLEQLEKIWGEMG